jgi:hypothetical protein
MFVPLWTVVFVFCFSFWSKHTYPHVHSIFALSSHSALFLTARPPQSLFLYRSLSADRSRAAGRAHVGAPRL